MKQDRGSEISKIKESAAFLASRVGAAPRLAIVSGSGLADLVVGARLTHRLDYSEIPFFPSTGVEGHPGILVTGRIAGYSVCVLQGRVHIFEGFSPQEVVFPVRTAAYWGVAEFVVTNAAGAVNPAFKPGDLMLIRDHINLTGENPLFGPNLDALGPRFPDLTQAYDAESSQVLLDVAAGLNIPLREGVYAAVPGPSFETPAEVKMLALLGIDAVGMSTVPEVIALRHMGKKVVGLSAVVNPAAGLGPSRLDHQDCLRVAAGCGRRISRLLSGYCSGSTV